MIAVFCSCASNDQKYLEELAIRLKPLEDRQLIKLWKSSSVLPGDDWATEHNKYLNTAQVILFLISPDFIALPFHKQEIQVALNLREQKKAYIIPILLRPVNLEGTPLGELAPLPSRDKPILSPKNRNRRDEVMFQVAEGIINTIRQRFWVDQAASTQNSLSPPPDWEQSFDQVIGAL